MVEWKKLGEVISVHTGEQLNRENMTDTGAYPVINGGRIASGFTDKNNENANTITISQGGESAGFISWINQDFWAGAHCYVVENKEQNNLKYLFHVLKNSENRIMSSKQGAGIPGLNRKNLYSLIIPIPSLEEQERIVGILDTFTASIDNIKAQIEQRRKQYEHYRNTLLTFNKDDDSVEWKTLEDIFELRNGYTPSKANSEFWTDGTIPWFRMEDIRDKGRILSDSYLHITESAIKGKGLFKTNSFILATTATIGEHALLIADSLANQRFTNLKIRKSLINNIDIKFMFYYMFVVDEFCKSHTNVSGFASVDMNALKRMAIPIPSLARQQEIVSILDTFEASITNLEAQLEQRQKQYEYYREELLTF